MWLTELGQSIGRRATFDDIPDCELDRLVECGFDWIWLLSVWQTGEVSRQISLSDPDWMREFQETLPDLTEEDIPGSGFAISRYVVHEKIGGDLALARLRERMKSRGLKLMLDFVPNHTALDHDWAQQFPDYYIRGNETILISEPKNYTRVRVPAGEVVLAHGRDPYFPGWTDTLQLNYSKSELQDALINELIKICKQCDGVRCDMAMLMLPEIFQKTWGLTCRPFWPAAIKKVKDINPDFCFLAEVYWDLEWTLQQQGFDFTYDKRLYDRLEYGRAHAVRDHFKADVNYQNKMARFLENHDEPRAAKIFPDDVHEAAAILTFLSPGLRFFHQGEFEGRKKKLSPHLGRAPIEPVNERLKTFYQKLLSLLHESTFRQGSWQLLNCEQTDDSNRSHENYICFAWQGNDNKECRIVVVNYSPGRSQCFLKLSTLQLAGKIWMLNDEFGSANYERNGDELHTRGLFLDEPGWKYYVFALNEKQR